MKANVLPALIAGALTLAGCADGLYKPYNLDSKFGQSHDQIFNAQIADPQAAENPPADSPRKMDGYAGVNTLRSYRNGFGQDIQPQGLTINIGGSSGGGGGSSGSGSGGQ